MLCLLLVKLSCLKLSTKKLFSEHLTDNLKKKKKKESFHIAFLVPFQEIWLCADSRPEVAFGDKGNTKN